LQEVFRAEVTEFLASEKSEYHSASRTLGAAEHARQLKHRRSAGGIVVGAVVDVISVYRSTDSQVIKMGREQHSVIFGAAAGFQFANHIPCCRHLWFVHGRDA